LKNARGGPEEKLPKDRDVQMKDLDECQKSTQGQNCIFIKAHSFAAVNQRRRMQIHVLSYVFTWDSDLNPILTLDSTS